MSFFILDNNPTVEFNIMVIKCFNKRANDREVEYLEGNYTSSFISACSEEISNYIQEKEEYDNHLYKTISSYAL